MQSSMKHRYGTIIIPMTLKGNKLFSKIAGHCINEAAKLSSEKIHSDWKVQNPPIWGSRVYVIYSACSTIPKLFWVVIFLNCQSNVLSSNNLQLTVSVQYFNEYYFILHSKCIPLQVFVKNVSVEAVYLKFILIYISCWFVQ